MMFAVIALTLVAAFGLLDGLVRARIERHRTGDSGIRVPSTPLQWWARGTLALGTLLPVIAAPIAELLGLPPLPLRSVGNTATDNTVTYGVRPTRPPLG
jgi:hypothetical protein